MVEMLKKHREMILATMTFVVLVVTCLFMFVTEYFAIHGESVAFFDALQNIIDEPKDYFLGMLGAFLEGLFEGGFAKGGTAAMGVVLVPIFSLVTIVYSIVFVISLISAIITFVKGVSKQAEWSAVSLVLGKKFLARFKDTVVYLLLGYTMLGGASLGLALAAPGYIFIILSCAYILLKNLYNNVFGDMQRSQSFVILYTIYDVLKIATGILVLCYIVKVALIQKIIFFISELFLVLVGTSENSAYLKEFLKSDLWGHLTFIFAYSSLQCAIQSVTASVEENDLGATVGQKTMFAAMIWMIVALVMDLIVWFAIEKLEGVSDWMDYSGEYFVMSLVFLIIAVVAFKFNKVIALNIWQKYQLGKKTAPAQVATQPQTEEVNVATAAESNVVAEPEMAVAEDGSSFVPEVIPDDDN